MAKSVITPNGTLAFPTLFEPRSAVPGQEPRYSAMLLFDEAAQKSKEFKELQNEIAAAAQEKWGNKLPANLRMPIRDASEKSQYGGFEEGKVFINPWSKQKPGLVGPDNAEIYVKEDVWAGQLARAYIRPFAYEQSGNKGVGLMLEHVQVVKKNMPRTDGRKAATAVFGTVADDSDEI